MADRAAFYLAGADLPVEIEMLRGRVAAMGWSTDLDIDNDTFALLRAGTESPDAVAVVCGAGINCVGVTAAGGTARFPSLGRLSGDWGGGLHLGGEALWHAVRAEDGRGGRPPCGRRWPTTSEPRPWPRSRPGAPRDDLRRTAARAGAAAVRRGGRRRRRRPSRGGPAGRGGVADGGRGTHRLDLLDRPADLVLGGGVLASRDPLLLGTAESLVRRRAPEVEIRVVDAAPVVGAALLGLDALGSTAEVEARLRSALLARTGALGSAAPA